MIKLKDKYFYVLTTVTWVLLSVIMSLQLYSRWQENNFQLNFFTALGVELIYSSLLLISSPVVLWLSGKFFFEKKRWVSGTISHIIIAVVIAAVTLGGRRIALGSLAGEVYSLSTIEVIQSVYYGLDYGIMSYLLIAFFCYSYIFYGKFRERELQTIRLQSELANAQLQVLKSQLQPHFLFNTLNSISALIRKQENTTAIKMLSGLGTFLRYSLEKMNVQEITLKEEIEFIDLYLDIQQLRFNDRLQIKKNIDPLTQYALFPNLLLQPLIENAIQHGISQNCESGLISIESIKEDGSLKMRIFNDGTPLSDEYLNGVGLSNTRTRLQKLYGDEQTFRIYNVDGGVQVELTLPYRMNS